MFEVWRKCAEKVDPNLRWLASYLLPYKRYIAISIIFMIAAGLASSLIAKLLGSLTDIGFYKQESWIILAAPIGLIFISVLHGGSMFMSNYLLGKVSQKVLRKLRAQIFHRILRWPSSAYQANSTGQISSKFVFEANFALSSATKSFIVLVRDSFQVIALTGMLIWHNVFLALISLIIIPLISILLRYISSKMKSVMSSSQTSIATLLVQVKEVYEAQRLIKISNTYQKETEKFRKTNETIKNLSLDITKFSALGDPLTQFICFIGVAIVLTIAMIQTQMGLLTLGDFVTFLAALLLLMPPLRHLAGLNASLVMMKVAASSLKSTMENPLEEDRGEKNINKCLGQVSFEHVSLRYPGTNVDAVHDFNLHTNPGDIVALVGLSGSGKTSLVNMIPRFWNPTGGRILIDGIDTQELKLESLRKQIAIVSQNVFLFDDTILANIKYGNPDATDLDIEKAVEAAALTDFISLLPQGLDTLVGEAGDRLSGGQRQRISIARALLKNAPILILDEATSALDSVSEAQIKNALSKLMQGRTTFVVAHRFSTIENAKIIVVMEKGIIKEVGTKKELLEKGGLFAKLAKLQNFSEAKARI
ncbi:MAG: Lipid A export ATP-binding/permease protein MsbA [Burkholderia sp.]|jgi:ATP-binding cassette, subfamily B, bacterial MsbA